MRRLLTIVALTALFPLGASAQQTVNLWEISTGLADVSDADYVLLKVSEACSLDGMALVVEDDTGTSQGCYVRFDGAPPVSNGYVLIGPPEVEAAHGIVPDFLAACAHLAPESGRICLVDSTGLLDCVAYGQFTGDNSGWGSPTDGLQPNQALVRIQTTGLNSIDWQRSPMADPGTLLAGRLLPPGGVTCTLDGGTSDGGTLDSTYLEYPGGGLCPTIALGELPSISDGGTPDGAGDGAVSDGGTDAGPPDGGGATDGGGTSPPGGGGGSQPYEPSSCCNVTSGQTAVILLPLGLALLFPGVGRRRWRD